MTKANHNMAECPSCQCRYQAPEVFWGRRISCKKCGTSFKLIMPVESEQNKVRQIMHSQQGECERISKDDSYLTIGKLAVKYRFASVEQIKAALSIKARKQKAGRNLLLGEILVENGLITQSQLDFLHSVQKMLETRKSDRQFGLIAAKNEFATREEVDRALQAQEKIFKQTQTVRLLGDIMIESGLLSTQQRDAILIRQHRLKESASDKKKSDGVVDTVEKAVNDEKYELRVTEDRLGAFISFKTDSADKISTQDIKDFLERSGIKYGIIDDTRLADYLKQKENHQKPWKVAEGTPPEPGRDASIKYIFELDPLKVGLIKQGGAIDFKDRGVVPQVKKGDLLAKKKPGTEGSPGTDIYGQAIPAPGPADIKLRLGKGASISEDGFSVFAGVGGIPKVSIQGKVYVVPQLDIPGDVGLKTGHIDFDGKIQVSGSIQNGFRVQGHSLTANEILKAEVEIKGDTVVSGGIIGANIHAGGHIRSIYIRDSDIEAFGDVVVEKEIIDSKIATSGACIIKSGTILSSTITAKKGIWATQIGSDVSKPCSLMVGIDLPVKNELDRLLGIIFLKKKEFEESTVLEKELDNKSRKVENDIGKLAQIQDRAMIELRKQQVKMAEAQKANDKEQQAKTQAVLENLDAEIKKVEKNLEIFFNLQDQFVEQISDIKSKIGAVAEEIDELEERITEITEYSGTGKGVPEIRVNDKIFPDTKINGIYAALRLPQSCKKVLIKECRVKGPGETLGWDLKVLPLR